MMNVDTILDVIDKSENPIFVKNIMKGFIFRSNESEEKRYNDKELIKEVGKVKNISEVVLSTDEVKIYKVESSKDDWDSKYPFRSIFLNQKGDWERVDMVSPTFDTAMLVYLERKHLGSNSQFSNFAMKMLGIKIEE